MSEFHPCSRFAGDPTPCDGNDEATSNCQCFHRAEVERAATERIVKLIYDRFAEWHDRIPDEQPDWREACTEIRDAIERGEHR